MAELQEHDAFDIISDDEFKELLDQDGEGDEETKTMSLHRLTGMPFKPPRKGDELGIPAKIVNIHCMLLNVTVPVAYVNKVQDFSVVILPGYDDSLLEDFEYLDTVFQYYTNGAVPDVWYYRLAPTWWDWRPPPLGDELSVPVYTFRPSPEGELLDKV